MSNTGFLSLTQINQLLSGDSPLGGNKSSQWFVNNGYGSNSIVFSVIKKLATTSANTPLIIVDSNDELIEDGELFDKLQQPAIYRGQFLDTKSWIEYAMTYLLTSGNVYQRLVELDGIKGLPELEIIPSGIIKPLEPKSYLTPSGGYIIHDKNNTDIKVDFEELEHTKYINPTQYGLDTLQGLSPLQAGLFSLIGSTDIQKALSVNVKNQGIRGMITPDIGLGISPDPNLMKRIAAKIKGKLTGISKINAIHISDTPVKYLPMGMSAADLKLIESGILTDRQICNLYQVDSKLFNDPAASTFNNLKEATKGMYENAIIPSLNKIVGSFNQTIAKQFNSTGTGSQFLKIDIDSIKALQGDQKIEADKDKVNADGINVVLTMPISNESKVITLVHIYGMSEDVASNIVGDGAITED